METSYQRIEKMRKLERELFESNDLNIPYIELTDRLYRKEQNLRVLDSEVYTNPYFSKCEDRTICDYAITEELLYDVKNNNYRYHFGKNIQLINYTIKTLCILDHSGYMCKIPPTYGIWQLGEEQGIWIIERSDYGYEQASLIHKDNNRLYSPPTNIHCRLDRDNEPRFRKMIYRIKLSHLDTDDRTPIYIPPMNIVVGITNDDGNITDEEVKKYTRLHPMFSKPENFVSEYVDNLKIELTKSNSYSILVNDSKSVYTDYYVAINNVVVRVPVTNIPTDETCMSVIFKSPSTTELGSMTETIIDTINDYDSVFKPCTTLTIKSNKSNLINTYQLICGTDLKQVQDALRTRINSLGAVTGYTAEDLEIEVQKQTQIYKEKLAMAKQEIEHLKMSIKIQKDKIDEFENIQRQNLLNAEQQNAMAIAQTKLQRELVTTRSKEISATSDMFKVAIGAAVTIGGALIYLFSNRDKEVIKRTTTKTATKIGSGLLGFGINKLLSFSIGTIFRPLSGILGGLFNLLF